MGRAAGLCLLPPSADTRLAAAAFLPRSLHLLSVRLRAALSPNFFFSSLQMAELQEFCSRQLLSGFFSGRGLAAAQEAVEQLGGLVAHPKHPPVPWRIAQVESQEVQQPLPGQY